jgi:hypothetical protein
MDELEESVRLKRNMNIPLSNEEWIYFITKLAVRNQMNQKQFQSLLFRISVNMEKLTPEQKLKVEMNIPIKLSEIKDDQFMKVVDVHSIHSKKG